ncbi:CaiB/BaiF CoA transferase family protein [Diaphorobacter nitroreducens]|uniref:CaiB/BaiF CoA transferase family protein n=1 Tax=Diaphorobacter nitroreducens TaxID=164759 RepID=UPI0028999F70|nr:CaiB/BaiF CoA-transferase family protein [Diaphorobacter nitroreducens]
MAEQAPPTAAAPSGPLSGMLVVALEQAVAVPYCTSRLADAGARVIKIERPEGDFARRYDRYVQGESSYFVWINRGKESIALDLRNVKEAALLHAMVARADVFIQNLAPGAASRLGFDSEALRQRHPRLITCDLSGYGEDGPLRDMKAYDLLVQAESGLVSVNGAPGEWGRIGVSLCDINAGMNALIGIQQALLQRARTGHGSGVQVSLFSTAAELMSVPLLQTVCGGEPPQRVGLRHPTIAPYGAFSCADGRDIVISIQNEREWRQFCAVFMDAEEMADDPRFCTLPERLTNRAELDARVQERFGSLAHGQAIDLLMAAHTAFASVNSVPDLARHPQLHTWPMPVHGATVRVPAPPYATEWDRGAFTAVPAVDQHGPALRAEFGEATA